MEKLSLVNTTQTLNEEFKVLPEWRKGEQDYNAAALPLNHSSFNWAAGYIWNHLPVGVKRDWKTARSYQPSWTSNGAAEVNPNGDMISKIGKSLGSFDWSAGSGLIIKAKKLATYLKRTVASSDLPADYMGGCINSFPYCQQYGVFVISAKIPKGKGLWPAFWLLPHDKSWPPEIDVMEILGASTDTLVTTVHYVDTKGAHKQDAKATKVPYDLSQGYHEYAVDWSPDGFKFYFDGVLVHTSTVKINKPCYILANLAVGKPSNWGGAPDAKTTFPAEYKIKYIKVYQRKEYE